MSEVEEISSSEVEISSSEVEENKKVGNNEESEAGVQEIQDVSAKKEDHAENVHYEGETCIYTDPASKYQYIWNSEKSEWVPRKENSENKDCVSSTSDSGDKEKNTNLTSKDYKFDGESYTYTDEKSGVTYKYDNILQKWVENTGSFPKKQGSVEYDSDDESKNDVIRQDMSSGQYSFDGDSHLYTDPKDGTVYIWDRDKNAWFPKVDEDFLAHYQMNYGFTDTNKTDDKKEEVDKKETDEQDLKKKLPPKEPAWFEMDDEHNTKVYVSNLPLDITEEEFLAVMQKCGLVMRDVDTGKMKIKLYTEPGTDQLKGDALCTYIKVESVELALKLIDGSDIRGKKIKVERAKFQMKGSYDPNLKPRKRRKKDKEKMKKIQEKLFDWRPDKLRGERSKHERVVIVKNLFEPSIFEKEVALILEYQQDLREECSKCGDVRKVIVYDRNPEGVAQISFREPEEADECIKLLNGRWFGQRKITAETWDGKTKYKIGETDEETKKRLQGWDKFLEENQKKIESNTDQIDSKGTAKEDSVNDVPSSANDTDNHIDQKQEIENEDKLLSSSC